MDYIQARTAIYLPGEKLAALVGWVEERNPTYTFLFFRQKLRSIGLPLSNVHQKRAGTKPALKAINI